MHCRLKVVLQKGSSFGYMLTKEDFGGFERYNYISRTSLGEMTGDIYEEEVIRLINESSSPSK